MIFASTNIAYCFNKSNCFQEIINPITMNTTATSARICACCKRELSSRENFTTITVHKSLTNTARSAASGAGSIGKNAGIPKKQETAYYYRNRRFPSTHGTYSTCIGKDTR